MTMTRVLLVDDDAEVRASLRLLLKNEPDMDVVGQARDGREAVQRALALTPDVVLMDVRMPVRNGLEAAQDLCARADGPQIIMLTVFDLDEYVYEAMKSGASGFLLKNSSPSSILSAIRAAREGASLLSPEITMRLIEHMAPMRPDKRLAHLTPRERETLALIGRGLSNDELAAELFITPTTARTYVSRIMTKVGARDRAQLVVIAYENGIVARRR